MGGNVQAALKGLVERIERLNEERENLGDDVKHVFAEAKATGFDAKALRKLISMRKRDADERREEEQTIALYMRAMGMDADGNDVD